MIVENQNISNAFAVVCGRIVVDASNEATWVLTSYLIAPGNLLWPIVSVRWGPAW
jgi:hypothetical protein